VPTIAHLSDTHLDGSDERLDRLTRVLSEAASAGADAVLVTGDLADHGLAAEYAQFREAMPDDRPWIAVPGNHDRREVARPFLGDQVTGPLDQVLDIPGLRIVGLDSLAEGAAKGALAQESLEFADRAVRNAPGPVVLALHHPPVPVGHQVMDGLGLCESSGLARIAAAPNVAAVLTGHVHTSLAARFAGTPLFGAGGVASTMRLGSRTDPITDARAMPAFAVHVFDDNGWVRTVFHPLSPQA
jgi:3',5'-cyclic-AMP phosphodiesterase